MHFVARTIPKQFSWIDQRLIRESYIDRLSHAAMGLYLFLVTVSDAKGGSFYSEPTLKKRLSMSDELFQTARRQLIEHRLIDYQKPFYQVLSLEPLQSRHNTVCSIRQLLQQLGEKHDQL